MPKPNMTSFLCAQIEDSIAEDFRKQEREDEKARRYDIISVATPTQFTQIWDRMCRGENFDKLVDELGKIQTEQDRAGKGRAT